MRTAKIAGKVVEMYDTIEELPITRFHKYNKMLLIDSGIGSDLADFDRHIEKAIRYAGSKTPQMAITELENLRQNVYFMQSELSPRCLAFAALVKSIDGEPCDDLSDAALQKIVETLGDAPKNAITAELEAVKKKIDDELHLYFATVFDDSTLKEYYDKLKRRTLIILQTVIDGGVTDETAAEIEKITTALITYFNPQVFTGTDSVEIQYDKQFENMCLLLSQNLHVDPKRFTVLEYYNAFEYIKEMQRAARRQRKSRK